MVEINKWVNEIHLPGTDKFSHQFNLCTDLLYQAHDETLSPQEREYAWKEYCREKLKLEQGWY